MKISRKWYAKCKVMQYPLDGCILGFEVASSSPTSRPSTKYRRGSLEIRAVYLHLTA